MLALEIIKGKHPGEYINKLASYDHTTENLPLVEFLDQRLPYPTRDVENILISVVMLAGSCLNSNSQCRPTMQNISNMLVSVTQLQ